MTIFIKLCDAVGDKNIHMRKRNSWERFLFCITCSGILSINILIPGDVRAAQVANIQYIHNYITKKHGITVPIKSSIPTQIANVKYLLCAVDAANLALNGSATTSYCTHALATQQVVDTSAVIDAVDRLVVTSTPFFTAFSQTNSNWWNTNPVSWTGTDGTYIASASAKLQDYSNIWGSTGYGPGIVFASAGHVSGIRDGWAMCCGISSWIQIQLPRQKVMKRFRLYTRANVNNKSAEAPKGFSVTASNDGSNWTTIYSTTGTPPGWPSGNLQPSSWMTVTSPGAYLYYRLNVQNCTVAATGCPAPSTSTSTFIGIGRWEIEN